MDTIPEKLLDLDAIQCSNQTLYQDCEILRETVARMEGLYSQQVKDMKQTHQNIKVLTKRHQQVETRKKRSRNRRAIWTRIIGAVG